MDVNFAKGLEAWVVAEGFTVDTAGHVEARILRALRALALVAGQGGFVAFNNEVLTLLNTIAAAIAAGGGDADTVGGYTPGTAGGAVLESETAAQVRTAAGLGTMATQNATAVALTGGTSTGVANGARTTSSGTDTLVAADVGGGVTYGASCTVTITSGLAVGSWFVLGASATATLTYATSGGETTSEASTALAAGQARILRKESATAWRVLQLGSSSDLIATGGVEITETMSAELPAISVTTL